MYRGLFIYMLGIVSMLAIDLAGHLHSVNDEGTHSHSMFTYTREQCRCFDLSCSWNALGSSHHSQGFTGHRSTYTHLHSFRVHCCSESSIHERFTCRSFLCNQRFFSTTAWAQYLSFLFHQRGSGLKATERPPSCCQLWIQLLHFRTCGGLVVLFFMVRRYKYKERDDRPYDQSVVKDIFIRRAQMRSPTPDYDDMDG